MFVVVCAVIYGFSVDVQAFMMHPYLCKGRKSILHFHDKCYHELRIQVLNALCFLRLLFRLCRARKKTFQFYWTA